MELHLVNAVVQRWCNDACCPGGNPNGVMTYFRVRPKATGPGQGILGVCVNLALGPGMGGVTAMADGTWAAIGLFACAFFASAFAGLAALLRFGKRLTPFTVTSAMLNSGMLGLAIMLLRYDENSTLGSVYQLLAICILAGLGGSSLLDFCLFVLPNPPRRKR